MLTNSENNDETILLLNPEKCKTRLLIKCKLIKHEKCDYWWYFIYKNGITKKEITVKPCLSVY